MNIQEIFNRVIDHGYYDISHTDSAMCSALYTAWYQGVVSYEEYLFAGNQIRQYLGSAYCVYLFTALKQAGLPNTIEARTAIYRDWANRPSLSTTSKE